MEEAKDLTTKATQVAINDLNRYKVLAEAEKVREIAPQRLDDFCLKILLRAFFNSGSKPVPDDDMRLLIQELYNDLKNDYPGTSIDDVAEAIRRGSKGQYGEVFGITPKAWNSWINAYLKNETRLLALKSLGPKEEVKAPPVDKQRAEILEFINLVDSLYKSKKPIMDHYALIAAYNFLVKAGLIIGAPSKRNMKDAFKMLPAQEQKKERSERFKYGSPKWRAEHLRLSRKLRLLEAFQKMKAAGFDLKKHLTERI